MLFRSMVQEQHPEAEVRSMLWYVQDESSPLKAMRSTEAAFTSLIGARNAIVAADLALAARDGNLLRSLVQRDIHHIAGISSFEHIELELNYQRMEKKMEDLYEQIGEAERDRARMRDVLARYEDESRQQTTEIEEAKIEIVELRKQLEV